ncbi:ribosomal protein S18-alanine N-acetyltransferase [Undibacterium sp. Jales W-56]|uniref:ribosomal protein S18-alanine N-acetyltransferase n=1 Tax=Undibacterium sp. Jales W-56 TaxID=2897325 RepID=UPI0021D0B0F0|nr:ribosomal protein S18-alanine N-acetyltransferase [Undibacterium sp. Jales W-56]MCU6433514.1 ribosomal protein S18-alanine N-acetyltransferase [Undibacterium sp. Jales W-56]
MVAGMHFCRLGFEDVDAILAIEERVYTHPWTRGNFLDSLYSAYHFTGLRDADQVLIGYFILMPVVDEMHLLNLAVDAAHQGKGYARILLERMIVFCREKECQTILLEVRISNQRAVDVYRQFGFKEIGRRKGYYPAADQTREDAIVMRFEL